MTCKDCIHLSVCALRVHWGVGSDWNNRYTPDVEKNCKSFKTEAEIIKGFAEIVKANKTRLFNYIYSARGFDEEIDNLVKEKVGEENDK